MKIHQLYTESFLRNFTYLIELSDKTAIVIDPWEDALINSVLSEKNLDLKVIINTHEHRDHTNGNKALIKAHDCEVWSHENGKGKVPGLSRILSAGEVIELEEQVQIKVLNTPGHTFAHLCLLVFERKRAVAAFTGDALFSAGVGNCTNGGDPKILYETISEQFYSLDDDVVVYPGHEYLENNLRFTLSLEPENAQAKMWLAKAVESDPSIKPLTTTIGDERMLNAFFRLDNPKIRSAVGCEESSGRDVFVELRSRRDNW